MSYRHKIILIFTYKTCAKCRRLSISSNIGKLINENIDSVTCGPNHARFRWSKEMSLTFLWNFMEASKSYEPERKSDWFLPKTVWLNENKLIRIDWKWRRFADQMNQKCNFFNFSSIISNQLCISLSWHQKQVFIIILRAYNKWLSCQILAINEMGSETNRDRFVVLGWYQGCVYMNWARGCWSRCCQRWRRVAATTSKTLRTTRNGAGCS